MKGSKSVVQDWHQVDFVGVLDFSLSDSVILKWIGYYNCSKNSRLQLTACLWVLLMTFAHLPSPELK